MKFKLSIAAFCVFVGACFLWGFDIAMGVALSALGVSSLLDVLITSQSRRYKLTVIHGTFRAEIEGDNLKTVELELSQAVKRWKEIKGQYG